MSAKSKFWFGIALLAVLYFTLQGVYFSLLDIAIGGEKPSKPFRLFSVLISVALLHIVLFGWMRFHEKRPYLSLIGERRFALHEANLASLYMLGVFLIGEVAFLFVFREYVNFRLIFDWELWRFWVIPLLIAVILQVSAEEFFFRGYMFEKLSVLYQARRVPIVIPSLIWGIAHQANFSEIHLQISIVVTMSVLGIIFADWRARSGSIIGPLCAHLINNAVVSVIYASHIRASDVRIWESDISAMPAALQSIYLLFPILPMVGCYMLMRRFISQPSAA